MRFRKSVIGSLAASGVLCLSLVLLSFMNAAPGNADDCGLTCSETVQQAGYKLIGCHVEDSTWVWGPYSKPRISSSVCTDPCESEAGSTTTCTTTYSYSMDLVALGAHQGEVKVIWTNTIQCTTTYSNGDPPTISTTTTMDAPIFVSPECCAA